MLQSPTTIFRFWLTLGLVWVLGYGLLFFLIPQNHFHVVQLYFSRASLLVALAWLGYSLAVHLPGLIKTTPPQPLMGVFRILFFGHLGLGTLLHPTFRAQRVAFFENTSAELSDSILIGFVSSEAIFWAYLLMSISGIFAMLGFQTKRFIFIFFLCSFYVFASENLFGKINHTHHFFWFPLLLLFSDCHRYFSIDEWLRKRKGIQLPFRSNFGSVALWLTIGMIYFFPGFWKVWRGGLDWVFTDSLINQFHFKWYSIESLPLFRIDHFPILLKTGGLLITMFELSFISMIFHKKTRVLAIITGCLFHLATWLFLDLFFYILILSYFTLIPLKEQNFEQPIHTRKSPFAKLVPFGFFIFFSGNILAGFLHYDGLFFTCYPTFSYLIEDRTPMLTFEKNGQHIPVAEVKKYFPDERFQFWEYQITNLHQTGNKLESEKKIKALIDPYFKTLESTDTLCVYYFDGLLNPDSNLYSTALNKTILLEMLPNLKSD